jgi:hypothetical protein
VLAVERLLKDPRINPSANHNYAIRWAGRNGHKEVVQLLLDDPRTDLTEDRDIVIKYASEHKDILVQLLLNKHNEDPKVRCNPLSTESLIL